MDTDDRQLAGGLGLGVCSVEQTNFHTYQMLRMNEAPAVEVHVIISCVRFHIAAAQIPSGVPGRRRESPQGSEADQHEGSSTDVHFGDVRKVGDPMGLALSPGASLHARTRAQMAGEAARIRAGASAERLKLRRSGPARHRSCRRCSASRARGQQQNEL
jgi:hypothetical protein